jgi:hypothetical protein
VRGLPGSELQDQRLHGRMKPYDLPHDLEERLWEWAYFFKDRKRLERCRSIEHRFQAHSEDFAAEGWGDMETAPSVAPARSYRLPRAIQTHDVIQTLDRKYKWALTYGYCFPSLPKFVVLRSLKKFTGHRMTWNAYLEILDIGRMRVYSLLHRGAFS